jgi:hypothetical protein
LFGWMEEVLYKPSIQEYMVHDSVLQELTLSNIFHPHDCTIFRNTNSLCMMGMNGLIHSAEAMGIPFSAAVRLAWVTAAKDDQQYETTGGAGTQVNGSQVDLIGRITTEGRVHHAFTGTGAVNVACAAEIPGSVPDQVGTRPEASTDRSARRIYLFC